MLIRGSGNSNRNGVHECDLCGNVGQYSSKYALVARGATGRYCEVLWACDECGDKAGGGTPVDQAREIVSNDPYSYADF